MIDLNKLLNKYGMTRVEFCKKMNMHPNNFTRLKDIDNQKFSTIEKIHNITNIPYNELLGRQVFTSQNIGIQEDNNIPHEQINISDELIEAIVHRLREKL